MVFSLLVLLDESTHEILPVTYNYLPLFSLFLSRNVILVPYILFLYRINIDDLSSTPFEFAHKPLGWVIKLSFEYPNYTLEINGVKYEDMAEAPPRERAALARTTITMQMAGPKKSARFGLLRKGQYIGVSAVLNTHTKFAKLQVGKHVVTAK